MIYKAHDLQRGEWKTNVSSQLSRYIVFEVSKEESKSKFLFNRNMLQSMVDGSDVKEDKLEIEAIEEIKKAIDNEIVFNERLFFFEWYPGNFIRSNIPPKWYLDKE